MKQRPRLDGLLCLDFGASALSPHSYPIEVAIADPHTRCVTSWLIRPTENWLQTGLWSKESQAVHNITLDTLLKDGRPVPEVAAELAAYCVGKRVLSDNPHYDVAWLRTLYDAATGTKPPFDLDSWQEASIQVVDRAGRNIAIAYAKAEREAQLHFPLTHRAGDDARCLAEMLRLMAGHTL